MKLYNQFWVLSSPSPRLIGWFHMSSRICLCKFLIFANANVSWSRHMSFLLCNSFPSPSGRLLAFLPNPFLYWIGNGQVAHAVDQPEELCASEERWRWRRDGSLPLCPHWCSKWELFPTPQRCPKKSQGQAMGKVMETHSLLHKHCQMQSY